MEDGLFQGAMIARQMDRSDGSSHDRHEEPTCLKKHGWIAAWKRARTCNVSLYGSVREGVRWYLVPCDMALGAGRDGGA